MSRLTELIQQIQANENTGTPMPLYRCHKEVWALKIKEVIPGDRSSRLKDIEAVIVPEGHFGPFAVPWDFVSKHNPEAGGYYVVYKDGYKSFSPAAAFEEGYTKVE